jgi:hypothetical protein
VTNWLPVSSIEVRREVRVVRAAGLELPKRMWFSRDDEARVTAWWYLDSILYLVSASFSHAALGMEVLEENTNLTISY